MPPEAVVVVTFVLIAYAVFGATLAWGLHRAGGTAAE